MKRNLIPLVFSFFLVLFLAVLFSFTPKAKAETEKDLPEQAGTYDVPGHPKLKLRVFVHNPGKPSAPNKPTPSPAPLPTPTCGLPDPGSTSEPGLIGWHLPSKVTYRLNTSSVPGTVGSSDFSALAGNSFNAWSSPTHIGNNVTFTRGDDTTVSKATFDGQNIITWGRTSGSALAVTYTWYDRTTGVVAETDTIFNLKFPWAWSTLVNCAYQNSYDAQDILTHELGHWMGLDDEYDSTLFENNTMYGYGSKTEVKKNTLTAGDIDAANAIYP